MRAFYIGTPGWALPRDSGREFHGTGTHLQRYSRVFNAVEINSTFRRPHKRSTYERWAAATPTGFRFSVKAPKEITHVQGLKNTREPLAHFLEEVSALGDKLGPILFQLPPSLQFDGLVAGRFLELLVGLHSGLSALEPRHESWFEKEPEKLLKKFRIARVSADPALVPSAAEPGGWGLLVYFRLHGTPHVYFSSYSADFLQNLAARILKMAQHSMVWCIFDNTAAGAASMNAFTLTQAVSSPAHRLSVTARNGSFATAR